MSETGATGAERLPSLWIRTALGVALVVCPAVWWLAGAGVRAGAAAGLAALAAAVPTAVAAHTARAAAREAHRATAAAINAAEEAARAQEQERHQRILHDRVLQIMEMLARGDRRFDTGVRGQVAEEAAWLRDLVETGREREPGNLVAELETLARAFALQHLRVEVNTAGLAAAGNPHDRLPRSHVSALVEATREALTNVVKHAGTDVATIRVNHGPAGLVLTIVDAGRGFDGEPAAGTGLRRSVIGRLTEVGGAVLIESASGEGTSVELRLPIPKQGT
ncbi:sensor histidine kinase [Streptomyces sp. NPDC090499]|uniref:sensor histidine kinase n=1 Tax=Streptomyces sp. NPDC090499 TaxID=3365965 RepID=UPI003804236A